VNAKLLKKAVRASNAFLSETRAKLTEEGIARRAVDAGNVCLTDIFIPKEGFESFKAEEGAIGINIDRLDDVLKAVKDDFVEIKADSKTLKLKAGKACYSIALIDPLSLKHRTPDIAYRELQEFVIARLVPYRTLYLPAIPIDRRVDLVLSHINFARRWSNAR
jgi:proliferating cell nuclear antigen